MVGHFAFAVTSSAGRCALMCRNELRALRNGGCTHAYPFSRRGRRRHALHFESAPSAFSRFLGFVPDTPYKMGSLLRLILRTFSRLDVDRSGDVPSLPHMQVRRPVAAGAVFVACPPADGQVLLCAVACTAVTGWSSVLSVSQAPGLPSRSRIGCAGAEWTCAGPARAAPLPARKPLAGARQRLASRLRVFLTALLLPDASNCFR
jgi:hypothetical protein